MKEKSEKEVFRDYLRKKGLRYTREREHIIEEIFKTPDHFDVETLHTSLWKGGVRVSKASVYRLLPLLRDAGLIDEIYFEDGHMHYERIFGRDHHCHLRCLECKRIEEFADDRVHDIERDLARRFGYAIVEHRLEIKGLCPECRGHSRQRR